MSISFCRLVLSPMTDFCQKMRRKSVEIQYSQRLGARRVYPLAFASKMSTVNMCIILCNI